VKLAGDGKPAAGTEATAPADGARNKPAGAELAEAINADTTNAETLNSDVIRARIDALRTDPQMGRMFAKYDPYDGQDPGAFAAKYESADGKARYRYPDGAVPETQHTERVEVGMILDRFGPETGTYLSPDGTPIAERSLHPSTFGPKYEYNRYEVIRQFDVVDSTVAADFGQKGSGLQYHSARTVEELLDTTQEGGAYLKRILDN
jgi:hypothetical protein